MAKIPNAEYEGGRRGGASDAIRRRPNLLPSYTVGQALAALHEDATVAYNQQADIWANDSLYARYFNDKTSARHIVFAYSLLRTVESIKIALVEKSKSENAQLTESDIEHLKFFRRRGSVFLFVTGISASLEVFVCRKIVNKFDLSFGNRSFSDAEVIWKHLVSQLVPLVIHLEEAFTTGLQNQEKLKSAIQKFRSLVKATRMPNLSLYDNFTRKLES